MHITFLGYKVTFNQIKMAIYATLLTNYYGFKLKKAKSSQEKKSLRIEYSETLLNKLNIKIEITNPQKVPHDGQYLVIVNHRTIIDPLIVEMAAKQSSIFGHWIAKKELYNSFFFGVFVRNGATILIDRENKQMGGFFSDVKECLKSGDSIYMFPEGTRNKSDSNLSEFQGGAQLIALKNRIPILPMYIRTKANDVLIDAIKDSSVARKIEIEVGDIMDSKDRSISLEEGYKKQFNIA